MTTFPMITYRELDKWLEEGRIAQLIDLREQSLFERDRIWGSVNIPYEEFEYHINEMPGYGTLVFYCDRGAKSMVVCRDLARLGYHVADLAGGMLHYRGKYIDRRPFRALE